MMREGFHRDEIRHVIDCMRAIDREEILAAREEDRATPAILLEDVQSISMLGPTQVWLADDGEPVAVNGVWRKDLFTGQAWAFGTDRWPEVVRAMTRHALRVIVPWLVREGFQRVECAALAVRSDTREWLPRLGMRQEAVISGFGRQKRDYILYVWEPDHGLVRQWREGGSRSAGVAEGAGRQGREGGSGPAGAPEEGRHGGH